MSETASSASSAGSYSVADVRLQTHWQTEVSKMLKVQQLKTVLKSKLLSTSGQKADLVERVSWYFTKEEVETVLAEEQAIPSVPALFATRQQTLEECE